MYRSNTAFARLDREGLNSTSENLGPYLEQFNVAFQ